jgi:hypothetical protein
MNLDPYGGARGRNRKYVSPVYFLPTHANCFGSSTEVILFLVGPAGTPFQVHKELLFERIPYLDVDDPPNPKLLPDDDPTVFQFLMNYVCEPRGRIPPVKPTNAGGEIISPWEAIALYSLAEKWEVYDLSDAVMSRLVEYHKEMDVLPSPAFVRRAYEQADPSTPERHSPTTVFTLSAMFIPSTTMNIKAPGHGIKYRSCLGTSLPSLEVLSRYMTVRDQTQGSIPYALSIVIPKTRDAPSRYDAWGDRGRKG